jgi:hypothetical protein
LLGLLWLWGGNFYSVNSNHINFVRFGGGVVLFFAVAGLWLVLCFATVSLWFHIYFVVARRHRLHRFHRFHRFTGPLPHWLGHSG